MKRIVILAMAVLMAVPLFAKKAKEKAYEISYTYSSRGTIIGAAVMTFVGDKTM